MSSVHVAVGVIVDGSGGVLIAQRPQHKHQGGLWEFPGGKVEPGESVEIALRRELAEELGVAVQHAQPLLQIHHNYSDKQVLLDVWLVDRFSGEPLGQEGQVVRWVPLRGLWRYPFPAANRPILFSVALPELVAVTGDFSSLADFENRFRRAVDRGADMIYLRVPGGAAPEESLFQCAGELSLELDVPLCTSLFWVERLEGCIGLHLTSSMLWESPQRVELDYPLVGASCHNEQELVQAQSLGLDYIFLSPVRTTPSHPDRAPLGFERFGSLAAQAGVPVYGLGGLVPDDISRIRRLGGYGIAALDALWN